VASAGTDSRASAVSTVRPNPTFDIYVGDDGDSRWQARVPVTDSAAERYRTNTTALEAAVDDAWTRYHAADSDVRSVETALENETVVVNYAVDGVARRASAIPGSSITSPSGRRTPATGWRPTE